MKTQFALAPEFEQKVEQLLKQQIQKAKDFSIPEQLKIPAFPGSDRSLFSFLVSIGEDRANGKSWSAIEKELKRHKFFHDSDSGVVTVTKKKLKKQLKELMDDPILFLTCSKGETITSDNYLFISLGCDLYFKGTLNCTNCNENLMKGSKPKFPFYYISIISKLVKVCYI